MNEAQRVVKARSAVQAVPTAANGMAPAALQAREVSRYNHARRAVEENEAHRKVEEAAWKVRGKPGTCVVPWRQEAEECAHGRQDARRKTARKVQI